MAFQDQCEPMDHLFRWGANRHGAGDIGSAIQILRATVDQQQLTGRNGLIGAGASAIMDHRAVRASPCNRVEAQTPEILSLFANAAQVVDGLQLSQSTLWCLLGDPVQEFRQGRAIAFMGGAGPLNLNRILAGFRHQAGIGRFYDPGTILL